MEEIIKLKSRKDDLHIFSEEDTPNRLIMVQKGKIPVIDKMACLFNGELYNTIFPYTIDTKLPYRTASCEPLFIDPSGGPFLEKGIILDETKFFKHKVSKPTKTQMIGCEQGPCVKDEEEDDEEKYEENNKEIVLIIHIDYVGSFIFLKEIEENED